MESLHLAFELHKNVWFPISTSFDFEGPMFKIRLDDWIVEFTTDKSLSIEDCVVGVLGSLIFSGITDQSFCLGEGDIGRSGSVSLIISNNLDSVILPYSNTGVGCSKINSDSFRCVAHLFCYFLIITWGILYL